MKADQIDWSVLRGAIALLVISLAIGGGISYGSSYLTEQATRERDRERSTLQRVRGEYQAIDDEQQLIETYLPQYEDLDTRGVIGEEERLNWIETLREAALAIKLPSLRYELSPQEEYKSEMPLPQGAHKVFSSTMRLDVGLLHEEDLLSLLQRINRGASGLFTVSSCSLRRDGLEIRVDPKATNVSASCELQWLTIQAPVEDGSA